MEDGVGDLLSKIAGDWGIYLKIRWGFGEFYVIKTVFIDLALEYYTVVPLRVVITSLLGSTI